MSVELREFPRVTTSWFAKVAVPKHGMLRATIKNASASGAYIELDVPVQTGSELIFEMYPKHNGKTVAIRARAQVRHVTILSDNRGYGAGVQLIEISKEHQKILASIVKTLN